MMDMNGFKQLQNYPSNFPIELIIHDYTVGPCFLGFMHKFGYPPLIGITAYNNPSFTSEFMGGHQFYSYIAHNSLLHKTENFTFSERAYNMLLYTIENM